MDDGDAELSARARMRAAARERRQARARERGEILDLVVSGYTYEAIADSLRLSVKSVRRASPRRSNNASSMAARTTSSCRCCG